MSEMRAPASHRSASLHKPAPLALTVRTSEKLDKCADFLGVCTLKVKSPLLIEEKSGQKKTKETKSLTHETRQLRERVFQSGSNCSLNFSVFSRV
jgi:hypothetical protein